MNTIQNIYYSLSTSKFKYLKLSFKQKNYKLDNSHSISRKFCSIFWSNINWSLVSKTIGKLNILELGPGDGNYFKRSISIQKKFIAKYNGFDVNSHKKWKLIKDKKFNFEKFDGSDFQSIINKKNNLFISQSCLEHVEHDLKYFYDVKKIAKNNKKKIILIHCLPSPFCLFTYLAHGYRQYNKENINKISKIIGEDNTHVIKFGNLKLNVEHLLKTTFPLIFQKKNLMNKQKQKYYDKINKKIVTSKPSSFFFSSFIVMIATINFNKSDKNKLISNFFSSS